MKKTLLVMGHEIRVSLRRKTFLFFGFGLPILVGVIALVLMIANRGDEEAVDDTETAAALPAQGFVDEGGLIQAMPPDLPEDWLTEYPSEAAAQEAMENGEIKSYYVVSPDYVESGELLLVTDSFSPLNGGTANTGGFEWVLLFNIFDGDVGRAAAIWNPLNLEVTHLSPGGDGPVEDSWIVEMFPLFMTIILYLVIVIAAGILVQAITDEKKSRVMEVILSSVSADQMITGKIAGVAILGAMQMLAWIGVLWFVARFGGASLDIPVDFSMPTNVLVWAFIFGLMGYFMYGSQMAGLGALAPDVKDTRSASMIVLAPLIVVYMFNIVFIEAPNSPLATFLSFFPLTSPVAMMARMTAVDLPVWQPALAAVLQLLTAYLIVRLVARIFRAQTLLSGQSFSVKRYYRVLLGRA